ncbi:MAG: endonuclease III [Odoribacteraceae bacterium]|jgi:endonuclease-3|nr:endonuclease III [Odoribacteraceae bacterium]
MELQERYDGVIAWFKKNMPEAGTELHHDTPFGLLVAVVLSAQCTDKRVNLVTPALLARFPDPAAMASADVEEIFDYIKSVSFPNNKARHLSGLAKKIVSDFHGEVPEEMDQLQGLPGVGRKTANVMQAVAFGRAAMPVDTHVFRVSNRIGLVSNATTPLEVEKQLVAHIPLELLSLAHHWLILHGRYVCVARKPKCAGCGIAPWCLHAAGDDLNR